MFTPDMQITNGDGKKDPVLTMTAITVVAVLIKFLLSGFVLAINATTTITFGTVDGTVIGALLTPLLGAVVAHRYTDRKFPVDLNGNGKIDPEEEVKKEG